MAVIELGSVHHADGEPADPPARPPLHRQRPLLAALVTVFCLLTATGSTRPDPREPAELWSVPFQPGTNSFVLSDSTAFVLSGSAATAYDLRTGAVRWTRPGRTEPTGSGRLQDGVLLLPAATTAVTFSEPDGSIVSRDFVRETVAVDAATGRDLWRQPGEAEPAAAGRVLLTEWNSNGRDVSRFRAVRLRDGGTVWTRAAGARETGVTDTTRGTPAERLALIDPAGRTRVLDVTDGTTLATATLPWDGAALADSYANVALLGGQLLLTRGRRGGQATLTAYDSGTLREQWQIGQEPTAAMYGCGPVICLQNGDDLAGHDRTTGARRWQSGNRSAGFPLGDRLLLIEGGEELRQRLIDAATGRQLADLGTAQPIWDEQSGTVPYVTTWPTATNDFMLVSRLDADTGQRLLRGRIPVVVDYSCRPTGSLLTCLTVDNRLTVTDLG